MPLDNLPEPAQSHLRPIAPVFTDLGYVEPLFECQHSASPTGDTITGIAMRTRHVDGSHILQSLFTFITGSAQQAQDQLVTFHSGEKTTCTTNGSQTFDRIPGASATYHPGKTFAQIVAFHRQKLIDAPDDLITIRSNVEMSRELDLLHDRWFSHMVGRGLLDEIGA